MGLRVALPRVARISLSAQETTASACSLLHRAVASQIEFLRTLTCIDLGRVDVAAAVRPDRVNPVESCEPSGTGPHYVPAPRSDRRPLP